MTLPLPVLVAPAARYESQRPLFDLLAASFPVEFRGGALDDAAPQEGVIAWTSSTADQQHLEQRGTDALVYGAGGPRRHHDVPVTAQFGPAPGVPPSFRGARVRDHGLHESWTVPPANRDRVACLIDGRPVWVLRPLAHGTLSRPGFEPPTVAPGDTLYQCFNRFDWLRLLPLLAFLQHLTVPRDWSAPPLRACLMFDDPNLHWSTYGFIDFSALARHAREHRYHAAFATVPVDLWFAHRGTAELFRRETGVLSLLMHGNDHDGAELLQPTAASQRERLLAQALRRVARFERATGLTVARVMAPPHGGFDPQVADALVRLGYEALCVSRASLTACNPTFRWPTAFGRGVVEWIDPGLPVIPRHAFSADGGEALRIAAFLRQPIIPHGHHRDCAAGLDTLARSAELINGLGDIQWCDLRTLARGNYETRHEGETLFVRMLARRVSLPRLAPDIQRLIVVRPWLNAGDGAAAALHCTQDGTLRHAGLDGRESRPISVEPGRAVELFAPAPSPLDPATIAPPGARLWPRLRRVLAESRDRCAPWLSEPAASPR